MRTALPLAALLFSALPAWAQDGDEAPEAGGPAIEAAEEEPDAPAGESAAETEPEAGAEGEPPEGPAAEDQGAEGERAEGEPADVDQPAPSEPETAVQPAPSERIAHGAEAPAARVGRKPNKPLLYTAGGLAAATAVTYGLAYQGYAQAFVSEDRPYEDFDRIRTRTNTLTVVSGGLAAATLGTGVAAFVVGEF